MKVLSELSYRQLADLLGLDSELCISVVEVDVLREKVTLVLEGRVPPRTVTEFGFHPSVRRVKEKPDKVSFHHLLTRRTT